MADDSADAEPVEPTETEDVAAEEAAEETEEAGGEAQAEAGEDAAEETDEAASKRRRFLRTPTAGFLAGVLVVVLVALIGWLGYGFYQVQHEQQRRNTFVDTARQGALNLTSIDWEHAEDDIQRVLDTSTGRFYDDFQKRSKSFLDVVKQIKSKSEGTVTSSGLESYSADKADVLVSVTVRSTNAGVPEQAPQVWRMVLTVQDMDGKAKVSNVEFIQ
ncbi:MULTISPECIES: Mce protein [unclassified Mycolicibacterium]|uniref:Mce protein n=1 Tax=unclassified Mycolicibacterium TaxID=2636767 RepID=UPI0012DF79B9|nr:MULTISPECIES: Mce protein [unclassified Mycolicibacterium]MUL85095.1 Mce protein [Mycolicibacterium sp. CBMA 329]MUL91062.1 Mce protein [Mycolicibacterium sp. CBMA 331]MUL98267.1 Mce protein [Mycolicibacterium sp. CBMA 334]MUM26144.1 Mce protein [Mycolicibacterium sp. CBMA 295]MUM40821.1 Mce protein [Mycolicibacterium sp. CBMA 247]